MWRVWPNSAVVPASRTSGTPMQRSPSPNTTGADGSREPERITTDAGELLPGMWDLPGAFAGTDGDRSSGAEEAAALLPFPVEIAGEPLGSVRHAITYRRITLDVRAARAAGGRRRAAAGTDGADLLWCRSDDALARALSSPARRILRRWGRSA